MLMANGADVLRLDALTYLRIVIGGPSTCGFQLLANGKAQALTGGAGYTDRYDWILPNSSASRYECRHVNSGTAPDTIPAASGTWVPLTSTRKWETTSPVNTDESRSFVCEIGLLGTSTAIKSVTITIDADGSP